MWNDPQWASQEEWDAYAWFGFAISEAQMLEKQLLVIATALATAEESPGNPKSEWFGLYDTLGRLTLGQLVGRIRKHDVVSAEVVERLERAVKTRNELAHKFFVRDLGARQLPPSAGLAQEEFTRAASLFTNLWAPLQDATDRLLSKLNGDRDVVDGRTVDALRES